MITVCRYRDRPTGCTHETLNQQTRHNRHYLHSRTQGTERGRRSQRIDAKDEAKSPQSPTGVRGATQSMSIKRRAHCNEPTPRSRSGGAPDESAPPRDSRPGITQPGTPTFTHRVFTAAEFQLRRQPPQPVSASTGWRRGWARRWPWRPPWSWRRSRRR